MRVASVSIVAAASLAAGAAATAQYFEGFEHGDWEGHWTAVSGSTPYPLTAAAARHGAYGAVMDSGSWWRHNAAVVNDGDAFGYFFRGDAGRAFIGFTSDDLATEAYTVVAAADTGNLIIQRNTGFGFTDLAVTTPVAWSAREFYQVLVTYTGGIVTARVYDSGGSLLADPIEADTGYAGGGALLLRGSGGGSLDDVFIVPAPGSIALLAIGACAAIRRRR